jgi:hypothetical protein
MRSTSTNLPKRESKIKAGDNESAFLNLNYWKLSSKTMKETKSTNPC